MAFTAYADSDQFAEWTGSAAPSNATSLLRSATFVVAVAANRDPYNDTPSDSDAQVLADATCAQVSSWLALGVNPAAQGLDVKLVAESKLGSGDVKRVVPAASTITAAATALAPEARAVLLSAGLLWEPVPVGADPCDDLPHYGIDDRQFGWPFSLQYANEIDLL